jgi:hypothetical protein
MDWVETLKAAQGFNPHRSCIRDLGIFGEDRAFGPLWSADERQRTPQRSELGRLGAAGSGLCPRLPGCKQVSIHQARPITDPSPR